MRTINFLFKLVSAKVNISAEGTKTTKWTTSTTKRYRQRKPNNTANDQKPLPSSTYTEYE